MTNDTLTFLARYAKYNRISSNFYRTNSEYKILVNSVPKSGTHLVMKALEMAPGLHRAPIQFGRQRVGLLPWALLTCPSMRHVLLAQYRAQKKAHKPDTRRVVAVDSDSPFFLTAQETSEILNLIRPGWFAMGHLPYSTHLASLLEQLPLRMIVVLRDPRDVIVSHAHYLARKSGHYMYPLYRLLSPPDRIMTSITGAAASLAHPALCNIRERFIGISSWINQPRVYTTYFERLIGPRGNGMEEAQLAELDALMGHVGLAVPNVLLRNIADNLFGGTRTFTKGRIGRWRSEFDEAHIRAVKDLIGDLLVDFGYENDLDW